MSATLSVCMIVRDEADMLPGFLGAGAGLWDELCVIDTGSIDGTAAILEEAGAKLAHRKWDDDFSAARNASLELASGDWVMVLDADERVTPELIASARALLDDTGAGAATVAMRNDLPHGNSRRSRLLRIFRRFPDVAFTHRIHEDVSASVWAALESQGLALRHLEGEVIHLGYVREIAASREKKARDRALLERSLAEDPSDVYSVFKLLELARFWDDQALLEEHARRFHARLSDELWREIARLHIRGELCVLVAEGALPEAEAAHAFLSEAKGRIPPSAALEVRLGELEEAKGGWERARAHFEAALSAPRGADLQFSQTRPLLGLCRVSMSTSDLEGARAHAEAALGHNPRDPEALLALVTLEASARGAAAVQAFVEGREKEDAAFPEVYGAAGDYALATANYRLARDMFAGGLVAGGAEAELKLRAARAHLGAGDEPAARAILIKLMSTMPRAGLGVLMCDLVSGQSTELELDVEPAAAEREFKAWLETVWRGRHPPHLEAMVQSLGAVLGVFPWAGRFVEELSVRYPLPGSR